jgi:hypothetical protein
VPLGCFEPDPMEREVSRLMAMTALPNSIIIRREDPERNERSMVASWTFQWHGDWKCYPGGVKRNLLDNYKIIDDQNNRLVFRRTTMADVFTLIIGPIDSASQTRVTLIGEPF